MPSLKVIRKRIGSVKNTQQITKAMKMVAAAKLRKAQEACEAARPYAGHLDSSLQQVIRSIEEPDHPFLVERPVQKVDLVVMASDRGLCGAFNGNILRAAEEFLRVATNQGHDVALLCVGRRVRDYFTGKPGVNIVDSFVGMASELSYGTAELIAQQLVERYRAGDADRTTMIYSEFRSALSQQVRTRTLLPVVATETEEEVNIEHEYEPSREALLELLLPRHVEVQLFQSLLESTASEHGARMTAMDSASTNATDMLERLTLQMNRARQAIITTELMEIVSGKEALEQ